MESGTSNVLVEDDKHSNSFSLRAGIDSIPELAGKKTAIENFVFLFKSPLKPYGSFHGPNICTIFWHFCYYS
jgi:hypothetical protein